jgi:hypothetical protein
VVTNISSEIQQVYVTGQQIYVSVTLLAIFLVVFITIMMFLLYWIGSTLNKIRKTIEKGG